MNPIARGPVLAAATVLAASALLISIGPVQAAEAKKVMILGVDGLDPKLLQGYLDEGLLPNFQRLIDQGDFKTLETTMPPLSPVAWSTFITGMDPGGHGIFDFLHRDPETMQPVFAMSHTAGAERSVKIGRWQIPLSSATIELLRKGRTFWEILEDEGIPTTVFRMPVNFPPVQTSGRALSGMGTPDVLGTPGTFSYYTDFPPDNARSISGGNVYTVELIDNRVEAKLIGPKNSFRLTPKKKHRFRSTKLGKEDYEHPDMTVDFTVYVDPDQDVAKFVVQDREFILAEGEWSDWIPIEFEAVPLMVKVSAIGRFYLKEIRPDFNLYVTPLQIDPKDPAMPISTPRDWSHELCEELGYFYTQELPEDTKALTWGIFTDQEFWEQSQFVYAERRRALDSMLDQFKEGLLFFYFSSVDQGSHMLWRQMDPDHPARETAGPISGGIETLYKEMDEALGRVMEAIDDQTTLIVMSDHGFAPFYWGVNLNTYLLEKGYVKLKNPAIQGQYPAFVNVDWSGTRAYAVGLNGLYVNLKGREKNGIVEPGEPYERLLDQLEKDLLELRDPDRGHQAISLVVRTQRDFHGPHSLNGPDIIVGYNMGYRSSWTSPLGEFTKELFVENTDPWSGDHSMDYRLVPGVLITNRKITLEKPALYDLTVAVLDEYGIAPLPEMIGADCLGPAGAVQAAAGP